MTERSSRKKRIGIVVSDKMQKTIVVRVDRRVKHPLYGRYILSSKKFKAHDQNDEARMGDKVEIQETRPLSKEKRWRLEKVIERAPIV